MITILIAILLLIAIGLYVKKCLVQISTTTMEGADVPVEAVIMAWGRAYKVVGQGLYWLWWPKYKVGLLIPTVARVLRINDIDVHTKTQTRRGESTKPIVVQVAIHLTLPKSTREYQVEADKVPSVWQDCVSRIVTVGQKQVAILSGKVLLLKHLYYALAPDKLFDSNLMAGFFKNAIVDGVRAEMVRHAYTNNRQDKTRIEKNIKEYFLTDPSNLFVKCGIPPENLDVSILSLSSTDEVEHSLYAEEIATIEGKALQKEMDALSRAGVEKNIAALLVRGMGKTDKSIDFASLAQMGIALRFLGIDPSQQSHSSNNDLDKLREYIGKMDVEQSAVIIELLKNMGIKL